MFASTMKAMKSSTFKFIFGAFFLGLCVTHSPLFAQKMSKKEMKKLKKEWKKKAKNYVKNPLALKAKEEGYQKQIQILQEENNKLTEQNTALQAQIDSLMFLLKSKDQELAACQKDKEQLKAAYEAQKQVTTKNVDPGLVFKVQIGAFKYFDMNKYLSSTENFSGERHGGLNKYTIGKFRDYEMAQAFKKDIQRLGIRDAWVVPYIDGVRVTMQEARRYMERQKYQSQENE